MFRDSAANGLAFKGFKAPISSGQTGEISVCCCWWHLVAKVAFDEGLSAWQLVASAVQLSAVALAESIDAEAADWLMRTLHCKEDIEISDKEMEERNRTS